MPYAAPIAEQRFALEHGAGFAEPAGTERFAAASPRPCYALEPAGLAA